jgi:hypothetical protein
MATKATQSTKESGGRDTRYEISSHQYPQDLTSNARYGGNFVMFFINVMSDSKIATSGSAKIIKDYKSSSSDRGDFVGQGITNGQAVFSGGIEGAAKAGIATGDVANAIKGGVITAAASEVIPDKGTLTRPVKRLETAIALYMPNQLNIRYAMQYEEDSMATTQMLVKGGQALVQAAQGNFGKAGDQLQPVLSNFVLSSGIGGNAAKAIAFGSGLAANPKKEQVFKGVDFRTFQLSYQFFPVDKDEERNVRNIIHAFKYHMHPEFKDGDGFLYIYPSEFDIIYYSGGAENKNVHRHTSCVLKEMNVNYTPQGQFNALRSGMPVQINVDMTFIELALATKDKIGMRPEDGGL